jgi:hypothetical protein
MKALLILVMVAGVCFGVWWFITQRGKGQARNESVPDLPSGNVAIGDIYVSPSWVTTPNGSYPIRDTKWTVTDMSHSESYMSPVGIVLAIMFIWLCFLSLFFLLMRESRTVGYIQVTVQGNGFTHSTLIPAGAYALARVVTPRVNYARTLAAAA